MGKNMETYKVEKILAHRPKSSGYFNWKRNQITHYLIKWENYNDPEDNTWEKARLKEIEVPETVADYWYEKYPNYKPASGSDSDSDFDHPCGSDSSDSMTVKKNV